MVDLKIKDYTDLPILIKIIHNKLGLHSNDTQRNYL